MAKFKVGKLYRSIFLDYGGKYQEVIFRIIDSDFDHHKAFWEFKIEFISPKSFHATSGDMISSFWVRTSFLSGAEELDKNHPAQILYGKD